MAAAQEILQIQHDPPDQQNDAANVEARNILGEIASSPALSLRLRLWETEDALQRERIEQKEQSLSKTHNEIYQLFGLYFVFQGVILTALAQAQKLECHHWWIPFLLTVFADIAVTFAVWYKLAKCDLIKYEINLEKAKSKAVKRTMERFLGLGAEYDPNNVLHHAVVLPISKETTILWKVVITLVITAFASVTGVGCKLILCKRPSRGL